MMLDKVGKSSKRIRTVGEFYSVIFVFFYGAVNDYLDIFEFRHMRLSALVYMAFKKCSFD